MCCTKLYRWFTALTLAVAMTPGTASAQEDDTLSITGTFDMDSLSGTVGADLAGVYDRGQEHAWALWMDGVSVSHEYVYDEWDASSGVGYAAQHITRLHAASFAFEFIGPDADVLNEVVSVALTRGGLEAGSILELVHLDYFDPDYLGDSGLYPSWRLSLLPAEATGSISFQAGNHWFYPGFPTDDDGYPLVEPQRITTEHTWIDDFRPGNSGTLLSIEDLVDIGSSEPPVLPLTLSIADGSIVEGNKGTSRLALTVSLSRSSPDAVTVNYVTANGTALAKEDYTATSGTLTIPSGRTSGTITVAIKADRRREPNETFTVRLTNAVGAAIDDGSATATIVNDD